MKSVTPALVLLPFLFLCFAPHATLAQHYAAPGGVAYGGDASCNNPLLPCRLGAAVEDATDGGVSGNVIFIQLPAPNATVSFNEDLVGASRINMDVVFDTYTNPGPTTGVDGMATNNGDIIIGSSDNLTIAGNLEFQMVSNNRLEIRDNAEVSGPGFFSFGTGTQRIQMGQVSAGCAGATPHVGTMENVRIAATSTVNVKDQCDLDDESDLFVTNRLEVLGNLNVNDNNLWVVGPTNDGATGAVVIDNNGAITGGDPETLEADGTGTFFIALDPAALGGPPNTRVGAYTISGTGALNLPYDKVTDAGVLISLGTIGGGAVSYNRAGALYVTAATTHNGTIRNEGAARTEYDALTTLPSNMEIAGPGGEVFPGDGLCGTDDDSGIYLANAVTVAGNMIMTDTDDPATVGCVEGLSLGPLGANGVTTIQGSLTSSGASGITLSDNGGSTHNFALQGNLAAAAPPTFILPTPATSLANSATGNKVLFTGGNNQTLNYTAPLDIASIEILKTTSAQTVTLAPASSVLTVANLVELTRGILNTNGLLDANAAGATMGARVITLRNGSGQGQLSRGAGTTAYVSNANQHIPRTVEYNGTLDVIAGDEIPGSNLTPVAPFEKLEISVGAAQKVTLSRDIAVTELLEVITGDLDLNGFNVDLGTTGMLSETPGNTVKGTAGVIMATRALNAPAADNVGGLGAVLTSAANLGSTVVARGHAPQSGAGNQGIARFFDITPTTNSGLNGTLVFNYDESELGGADENTLMLFRSTNGGTTWDAEGGTPNPAGNNISVSGLDAFSRWTTSDAANPLPVELATFEARYENDEIVLAWTTASETNNAGFDVQRAIPGPDEETWESVIFIEGAGTTLDQQDYTYRLAEDKPGVHRFRLKQIDFDGTFAYSAIAEVSVDLRGGYYLSAAYPNPFTPRTQFSLIVAQDQPVRVEVFNTIGQRVALLSEGLMRAQREQQFLFDAANLPSGLYLIRVAGETFQITRPITLIQ